MWVFGYGSLMWRPSLPFVERRQAYVEDWSRRFWQGSTDHRGMPAAPGRVVTLIPSPGEACRGVAFRISEDRETEVLANLDQREKGGYEKQALDVHLLDPPEGPVPGLVYVAMPTNPNYLGPADLEKIAEQVRASHGPSGSNVEYVERLVGALREMEVFDEHVFALAEVINDSACSRSPRPRAPSSAGRGRRRTPRRSRRRRPSRESEAD